MDPISAVLAAGGIALQLFGAQQQHQAATRQNDIQQNIVKDQQAIETEKFNFMQVDARRRQLEVFRNVQRAKSLALTNATSKGAQFGSGLQGGYGQIEGEAGTQLTAISQNLASGERMYNINTDISGQKGLLAQAGLQSSTGAGLSSLGGSIVNNLGTISRLTSGFGGSAPSGGGGGGRSTLGFLGNGTGYY